jgi:hypothetical protein
MPEKHGSVIHGGVQCSFADIVVVSNDVMLHERCRHFEVGVGSAASWILEGDKVIDNVRGETASPNYRVACSHGGSLREVSRQQYHTAHANACGVCHAVGDQGRGYQFL